jgi:hypothetical protein
MRIVCYRNSTIIEYRNLFNGAIAGVWISGWERMRGSVAALEGQDQGEEDDGKNGLRKKRLSQEQVTKDSSE